MCSWGQLVAVSVIEAGNDGVRYGWNTVWCDACLAPSIQRMNILGIETTNCCCGHAEYPGSIFVNPESIPLLDKHGYGWIWSKDDPDDEREWWRARTDIVIVKLPLLEKTWRDDAPQFGGWA
jgi:hypothetical protein